MIKYAYIIIDNDDDFGFSLVEDELHKRGVHDAKWSHMNIQRTAPQDKRMYKIPLRDLHKLEQTVQGPCVMRYLFCDTATFNKEYPTHPEWPWFSI
jgi:hypothetical protein